MLGYYGSWGPLSMQDKLKAIFSHTQVTKGLDFCTIGPARYPSPPPQADSGAEDGEDMFCVCLLVIGLVPTSVALFEEEEGCFLRRAQQHGHLILVCDSYLWAAKRKKKSRRAGL